MEAFPRARLQHSYSSVVSIDMERTTHVSALVRAAAVLLMLATVAAATLAAMLLLSVFRIDSYKFVSLFLIIILASNILAKLARAYVGNA